MRYIFMDNFRGFQETLLPLRQITFLVGENSTGKSSFLKLLFALSRPNFWFSPEYSFQEEAELGNFDDMVSAWSVDKSSFRIGAFHTRKEKEDGPITIAFAVHTFSSHDGAPYVSKYIQYNQERLTTLEFQIKRTRYKIDKIKSEFFNEEDAIQFFLETTRKTKIDDQGYKLLSKEELSAIPLPFAAEYLQRLEEEPIVNGEFRGGMPYLFNLTSFAPIRTRPQRVYEGAKKSFSPEGDHTPFILRQTLRTQSESVEFAEKLKAFGETSGLYETIIIHPFDENPLAPFEILVSFSGVELNIDNVGYGVSQALPLIVEFLSRESNHAFAVQQPEVHLHPRAQAALGDLIAELAIEKGHRFILETHSDYLIDRCRYNLSQRDETPDAQVIFFQRSSTGNNATILPIDKDGKYPVDQPPEFRDFFIKEAMKLLGV